MRQAPAVAQALVGKLFWCCSGERRTAMAEIRWGVLSTAKIGRSKVIPATQRSQFGKVAAIASRDLARAKTTAAELGIEKAYGSYQELLADASIDAIYNPLPNHLHMPWSIRAIKAGKHVLCEKPIALSVAEAEQLAGVAATHRKLKVMEAFMYRFHPQWVTTRRLVRDGRIGQLRTIQTVFSYFNDDRQNIRNQHDIGGGALMDIGCYGVSLSRFVFDDEPKRVLGVVERDPKSNIDRLTSAVLEFFQGTAMFTCGTQLAYYQRVNIFGTTGRIEIEIPFNAPSDKPCRLWLATNLPSGVNVEEITFDVCDQYTLQADAFARAILDDTPAPTPLADAVANMRVMERVFKSAEKAAWE
jgi:predicted dehydrogenase